MGIFGYNEKSFDKSTQLFREKLIGIIDSLSKEKAGDELLRHLAGLVVTADRIGYCKQVKQYKEVDRVILDILRRMEEDAKSKRYLSLGERAKQLEKELNVSRGFGIRKTLYEEMRAWDVIATARQDIGDSQSELDAVEKQKADIIKRALNLIEDDGYACGYQAEYEALDSTERMIKGRIEALTARYDEAKRVLEMTELPYIPASGPAKVQICDSAAFGDNMEKISLALDSEIDFCKNDSASEEADGSLESLLEQLPND